MAPNLVTLVGLFGPLVALAILIFNDPTMSILQPSWCYCLSAFSLFFYQTMDAVDGKQARRTGASGPLGQLFDHGCDAITTTTMVTIFFYSILCGTDSSLQIFFFIYIPSHVSIDSAKGDYWSYLLLCVSLCEHLLCVCPMFDLFVCL